MKSQIPNPKSQTNSKFQTSIQEIDVSKDLEFNAWNLFGIWDLGFEISSS
jgi:hypothetical protein